MKAQVMWHFSCCMTAGTWCCEWPFLRVPLDKLCATSHTLPPRRPTLELLWEAKLHLCLKQCVPAYQSKGHCQGRVAEVVVPCYRHLSARPSQLPKQECGEGIRMSRPFFFFPPHPSHLSNAKFSKNWGLLQVFSAKQKFHTTQWQLTHPTAKFLFHIVQTHSFKFRDNNEHMR